MNMQFWGCYNLSGCEQKSCVYVLEACTRFVCKRVSKRVHHVPSIQGKKKKKKNMFTVSMNIFH